jgi:hypothetical protein
MHRPVKLYHETQWTVVIDPPNGLRCLMCFNTREAAQTYQNKVAHSYILAPANVCDPVLRADTAICI